MTKEILHMPVMLEEILSFLKVKPGGCYMDCTLGDGGHSEAILRKSDPDGRVWAFDRDMEAVQVASQRLAGFQQRITIKNADFSQIKNFGSSDTEPEKVDGILCDLGVSSRQLATAERGFSFLLDGPLDMRMDQSKEKNAFDLINNLSKKELAAIIKNFGEERRWAGLISARIVREREKQAISTTKQLAEIVKCSIPAKYQTRKIHPATKTFQAIRMVVNDELAILEEALPHMVELLNPGGRLAVISFHSLEDRIIKRFFLSGENVCNCPPEVGNCFCGKKPILKRVTRKAIGPGAEEINRNPRSRSAKLRVVEKT